MPRTASLSKIETQIAQLQQKAAAIRQKEKAGVISRIQEAISHYGLTADELFGMPAKASSASRRGSKKTAKKTEAPAKVTRRASPQAGAKIAAKFRDDAGNEWSGRGSQPRWLKAALAAGKALDDFAIKS